MRTPQMFCAVVLCAAFAFAAHAQQSTTPSAVKVGSSPAMPSGMSFSYDAQRGVISPSGIQLKTTTKKSDSVSPTSGWIDVTININLRQTFESGTTFHCSINAIGGKIDTDKGIVDGGIENSNTFATMTGPSSAACKVKIPFWWTLSNDPGADSGLIIAYGVAAVNTHDEVEHSTLQVDGIENLPANGSTSNFKFTVDL